MSTALNQVRDKVHAVEVALRDAGTEPAIVSPRAKAAGTQLAHKSILEALEDIENRLLDAR
ncbi:MAG: hypothetical protein JWO20_2489 [Candidatus Angelobacter sp.]|nr:hypothetical protein [Candidatus Angelobacter sp.]